MASDHAASAEILSMPAADVAGPTVAAKHSPRSAVVLACIGWPRDEATGVLTSLIGQADALSAEYRFKVLTREHKFSVHRNNDGTEVWENYRTIERFWCTMTPWGPRRFADLLRSTPHDILMLNSFFDAELAIPALVLRRLGKVPRRPTVLSVRGEFGAGALGLKSRRKRAYLAFAHRFGLLSDVWLHASGPPEAEDITREFPWSRGVLIAPDVRLLSALPPRRERAVADRGRTRLAFLGRISPVKNLDIALQILGRVRSPVSFDIFGPIQDAGYWQQCQKIIAGLPPNVSVAHKGVIANADVPATLAGYDLFFLPTRGENFGHAIIDALAAGLPVLISDQTPFQDLERLGAGWSLPLEEPARFVAAIEAIAAMSEDGRSRLRAGARRLAERRIEDDDAVARNRAMLAKVLAGGAGRPRVAAPPLDNHNWVNPAAPR